MLNQTFLLEYVVFGKIIRKGEKKRL